MGICSLDFSRSEPTSSSIDLFRYFFQYVKVEDCSLVERSGNTSV
jgi:hypothetical protein